MMCSLLSLVVCACLTISGTASGHTHESVQHPERILLGQQEKKDLELFRSQDESPGIISHIDSTKTSSGKNHLQELMSTIITDIPTLKHRQDIIAHFDNNPELLQNIHDLLTQVGSHEKALLSIYNTSDSFKNQAITEFFPPRWLTTNSSPLALDGWQFVNVAILAAPTVEHLAVHYLVNQKLKDYLGITCGHHHHGKKSHKHECSTCEKKHHDGHDHDDHPHHDDQKDTPKLECKEHNHGPKIDSFKRVIHTSYNIAHAGLHIGGLIGLAKHVKAQLTLLKNIQSDLIGLRHLLDAVQHMITSISHDEFLNTTDEFKALSTTFAAASTLQKLHVLLSTSTFSGSASIWSRPGKILAGYQLAQQAQQELNQVLEHVGVIDAFISLARAYHTSQQQEYRYTFPTYLETTTPQVEIVRAWHPLLNQTAISAPTIILGNQSVPHLALITGDNMSGKSTTLKMTALTVLFAQTCGFVPAQAAQLTPFKCIKTSLVLTDNIRQRISHFGAELMSAEEITTACEQEQNGFVFVVVDELFVGAHAAKGQAELAQFIRTLSQMDQVIGLIATHYTALTDLTAEYPGMLTHYHTVRAAAHAEGTYLYTLQHNQ